MLVHTEKLRAQYIIVYILYGRLRPTDNNCEAVLKWNQVNDYDTEY